MLRKTIVFIILYFLFTCHANKDNNPATSKYRYPRLYKHHIMHNLTEKGREVYFAVNIHPLCMAKSGECTPRSKCTIGKKILYLSRVCYHRDMVCCYDDTILYPAVGLSERVKTTSSTASPLVQHIMLKNSRRDSMIYPTHE